MACAPLANDGPGHVGTTVNAPAPPPSASLGLDPGQSKEITILYKTTRTALAPTHVPLLMPEPLIALQDLAEKGIAEELGVAYTTGQRAVERLQAAGIVSPIGSVR